MVKPIMSSSESVADAEWNGWKRELARRHKLREDEKMYVEWKSQQPKADKKIQKQGNRHVEEALSRFY